MPKRTITELLHLAAGLVATALITKAAQWAYPLGRVELYWIGWVSALVVVSMAVRPLRNAWRRDHAMAVSNDAG